VAMERPPYARYAAGRGVGQPLQNYKRSLDRIVTLVIAGRVDFRGEWSVTVAVPR
jgi:hypothetical protein